MVSLSRNFAPTVVLALLATLSPTPAAAGDQSPQAAKPALQWHDDYAQAWQQAKAEKKLLLVLFGAKTRTAHYQAVEKLIDTDELVERDLGKFVLARLPIDHVIKVKGEPVKLIAHASLAEMHGKEGIAIIDLQHEGHDYYGHVVSAFPFMDSRYYRFRADYLPTILTLPPGTITQRTMVWAVRVHPERPASTRGVESAVLVSEAKSHSRYQAQIGVQGHHHWDSRFMRILGRLAGRRAPVEVVAESWPNQNMIDSCVDCVASWRQSSGHWNAVKSYHAAYGYDIKRGSNGIWYGTGIFAN
jgi:hypothetical protein